MKRRRSLLLIAVPLALAMMAGGQAASADPCPALIDVQVDSTSCGQAVSVSLLGDANSSGCDSVAGCYAVSGTGDATTQSTGSCGAFIGGAVGCIAVSGTGDAENNSGTFCGYAGIGVFVGCIAVSGGGNATNNTGANTCGAAVGGLGVGCIAVSAGGNAENNVEGTCGSGPLGAGVGCLAISVIGDSNNDVSGDCGTANPGAGVGCVAISVLGDAGNDTGGCSTGTVGAGCIEVSPGSAAALRVARILTTLIEALGDAVGPQLKELMSIACRRPDRR